MNRSYKHPFPVDVPLTAMTIAYKNEELVADQALPRVSVPKELFRYRRQSAGQFMVLPETLVGRTSRVNEVVFSSSEDYGGTIDHGLEHGIPQKDIDEARGSGINPESEVAEWLTDLVLLGREVRVAKMYRNIENYATVIDMDATTSIASNDMHLTKYMLEKFSQQQIKPNTLVLSQNVLYQLQIAPSMVKAAGKHVDAYGVVSRDAVAQLLGFKRIIAGEAWVNLARPGEDDALERAWGDDLMAAVYLNPQAKPTRGITWGMSPQWKKRVAMRWFDRNVGLEGGKRVRIGEHINELSIAPNAGMLFRNPLAS